MMWMKLLALFVVHFSPCIANQWMVSFTGNKIMLLQFNKGLKFFFQVQNLFWIKVNNAYLSVVLGDTFQLIANPGGAVSRHPISDTVYIQPAHSCICVGWNDLRREIMLFPKTGNKYAVVDPSRSNVNLPKVIVPVYPELGDFVCVTGCVTGWRPMEGTAHNCGGLFLCKTSQFWCQPPLGKRKTPKEGDHPFQLPFVHCGWRIGG